MDSLSSRGPLQRQPRAVIATVVVAFVAALFFLTPAKHAVAMPPFAQAYGVNCSVCHTMVPALNAYGRYIQRTNYAGLSHEQLRQQLPFWIAQTESGKSTGGVNQHNPNFKVKYNSTSFDAVGSLSPAFTYRLEQGLWGGNLGRLWVSYNSLFAGNGHLAVGKMQPPAPPSFTNWSDRTGLSSSGISVGQHSYKLSSSRWGATFSYEKDALDAEVGWSAGSSNLLNASDFSIAPKTDKAFQWRLADAPADKPYEFGFYGANGTYVLPVNLDRYSTFGIFAQRDAEVNGMPGLLLLYQDNYDSNPGKSGKKQLPGTASYSYAGEISELLFNGRAMVTYRHEMLNNGLNLATSLKQGNLVDFGLQVPHVPYLFVYGEAAMGGYSNAPHAGPTWNWALRWAGPLRGSATTVVTAPIR